jgi:RNA polymerase-binding protein DksA
MIAHDAKTRNGGPGLHPEDLAEFEEVLKKRRALLADDVLGLEKAWTDRSELDPHTSPAESGTDAIEDDLRLARMEAAAEEIEQIEEALHRIHEGTFGICEECGKPISVQRLRAIPYARLCIPCKQVEEAA